MIVFLLLIIVAILLFGSSAVIGVFGAILGAIVFIVAVAISLPVLEEVLEFAIYLGTNFWIPFVIIVLVAIRFISHFRSQRQKEDDY